MDLRQLKYFVRIMQCGSLTRAAAALHLSQPTLGEHVRKLEEELGVELFVRHSRGIAPTAAARVLRERAEHLLAFADETRHILRGIGSSVHGAVTLGISPGLNEMFSADLIERCRKTLPGIGLNVVEELSAVVVERLASASASEALDLGLVSGFDVGDPLEVETSGLALEELYLVGTRARLGHDTGPCDFSELGRHPLVLLGSGCAARPHGLRRFLDRQAAALGLALDVVGELRSISAVRELVERDAGVTILPLTAVRQRIEAGALVARGLRAPRVCREIHLALPATRRPTAAVREVLLDLVRARLAEPRGSLLRLEP